MKTVYVVGEVLPGDPCQTIPFFAKQSLLDADIVVFAPTLPQELSFDTAYQGKRSLSESSSFHLKDAASHWR